MTEGAHEHEWHPLAYGESEPGAEDSEAAVILWSCSGTTRQGRCLAVANQETIRYEQGRRHVFEREAAAEREQRHFRWENE